MKDRSNNILRIFMIVICIDYYIYLKLQVKYLWKYLKFQALSLSEINVLIVLVW